MEPKLTDLQFRTMLDWWMCSDPWPTSVANEPIDDLLESESRHRGFDGVVDAYHRHEVETNPEMLSDQL